MTEILTGLEGYDPQTKIQGYDPARLLVQQRHDLPRAEPTQAEKHLIESIKKSFLSSVETTEALDWLGVAQAMDRGWNDTAYDTLVGTVFRETFRSSMVPELIRGAQIGRALAHHEEHGTPPKQASSEWIAPWAHVYADMLAQNIARESKAAAKEQVNAALNARLPAPVLADRLRQTYGLDKRDSNTYLSYLTNKNLPRSTSLPEVQKRMLVRRAATIADTEAFGAINFGRQLLYAEAIARGDMAKTERKVWVTALDEKVCPICRPMDGVSVPMDQAFEVIMPTPKTSKGKRRNNVHLMVPPVHPRCRCTIVPQRRFERGIITRTARYKDEGERHLAHLVSEAADLVFQKNFGLWNSNDHPRGWHGEFRDAFHNHHTAADVATAGAAYGAYRLAGGAGVKALLKPKPINPQAAIWTDFVTKYKAGGVPYLAPSKKLIKHVQDVYGVDREFAGGYKVRLGYIDMSMKGARYDSDTGQLIGEVESKLKAGGPRDSGIHLASPDLPSFGYMANTQSAVVGSHLKEMGRYLINPTDAVARYKDKALTEATETAQAIYDRRIAEGASKAEARAQYREYIRDYRAVLNDDIKIMIDRHPKKLAQKEAARLLHTARTKGVRAALSEADLRERVSIPHLTETIMNSDHPFIIQSEILAPELKALAHSIRHGEKATRELNIFGQIMAPDGNAAGWFSTRIDPKTMLVEHDGLFMRPEYRNAGFANEWLMHIIPKYMGSGIEKAKVTANADVGGYAWAKFPFFHFTKDGVLDHKLDTRLLAYSGSTYRNGVFVRGGRERIKEFKSMQGRTLAEKYKVRRKIDSVLERFYTLDEDDPKFPTPAEVANIGVQYATKVDGRDLWPGKELMLGSTWGGKIENKNNVYHWLRGSGFTPEQVAEMFGAKGPEGLKEMGFHDDE